MTVGVTMVVSFVFSGLPVLLCWLWFSCLMVYLVLLAGAVVVNFVDRWLRC